MHCFHLLTSLKSRPSQWVISPDHRQGAGCQDLVKCLRQAATPQPENDMEPVPGRDVSVDYCLKTLRYLL